MPNTVCSHDMHPDARPDTMPDAKCGTKEMILLTALRLFARRGFDAVSVSMIADELGMVKSALYKHYKSKREIFESILTRMRETDEAGAQANDVPTDTLQNAPDSYAGTQLSAVRAFTETMFIHWTQDPFASLFRQMLTVEQYRSEEMAALYEQYLCGGPLAYMADLFAEITGDRANAESLALAYYAPMFMLYALADRTADKASVRAKLLGHTDRFFAKLRADYPALSDRA